jgi:hypothetical protein
MTLFSCAPTDYSGKFGSFALKTTENACRIGSCTHFEPSNSLVFRDDILEYKARSCPPDYFLQALSDPLRGYSR